jgi:hypothetical protein
MVVLGSVWRRARRSAFHSFLRHHDSSHDLGSLGGENRPGSTIFAGSATEDPTGRRRPHQQPRSAPTGPIMMRNQQAPHCLIAGGDH